MMQNSVAMIDKTLNPSAIRSMVDTLQSSIKEDTTLANELLTFMKDHNIDIPALKNNGKHEDLPVSFNNKNSTEQITRLKRAFKDINNKENIL